MERSRRERAHDRRTALAVVIEPLAELEYPAWDAYVDAHPAATCYHLSGWAEVARAYRLSTRMLAAREGAGGPLRGVLPLFVIPRPFRRYVTNGIFGAYGAVLADDDAILAALVDEAKRFTTVERARYLHLKWLGDEARPPGLTRRDVWQTAVLALDGGSSAVWGRFKSSIRAAIRQAQRARLELRAGDAELPAFYDVLAANMRRKGAPIYGLEFMKAMLDAFDGQAEVLTLWHEGRPISGAMTLAYRGVLYVPFASSRAETFRLRPNNLLYWSAIERACELGLHTLDFGTSLIGQSTFAFKLHWGATPRAVPSYLYTPHGRQPRIDAGGAGVRMGVRLWQRLPRGFADALGPWVSRFMV
jgi:FemAB-related protein (PEP-CTERM system-associated)